MGSRPWLPAAAFAAISAAKAGAAGSPQR